MNKSSTQQIKTKSISTAIRVSGKSAKPVNSLVRFGSAILSHSLPPILLGAIVNPIGSLPDGDIIFTLQPAWEAILKIAKTNPEILFNLSSRQWEQVVAACYDKAGFDEVILTPRSGDKGRDVIAVKNGMWSVRIIDQVKAYKPNHLVKADEVRALMGVLLGESNASKGVVTTTSDFAPRLKEDPLISPFLPHRLQLVNYSDLIERFNILSS